MSDRDRIDDEKQQSILDLLEFGNLTLGLTEDGAVGVWLWNQNADADPTFASDDTADEALSAAAVRWREARSRGE